MTPACPLHWIQVIEIERIKNDETMTPRQTAKAMHSRGREPSLRCSRFREQTQAGKLHTVDLLWLNVAGADAGYNLVVNHTNPSHLHALHNLCVYVCVCGAASASMVLEPSSCTRRIASRTAAMSSGTAEQSIGALTCCHVVNN
jgi:hypothetical protein